MQPVDYQKLAHRTEADVSDIKGRIKFPEGVRLLHASLGISSEAGELADALKRCFYYGQEMDHTNVIEELGDCLWYIALACNALGVDMSTVMKKNIAKLKARYPDKFTEYEAAEDNRDRQTERNILNED